MMLCILFGLRAKRSGNVCKCRWWSYCSWDLWITSREQNWDEGLFLISSQSSHYDFVCMQENYAKTIFYIWPKGVWGVPGPFFVTASPCKHDHRENYISVEFFWPDFHHSSQLLMRFDSILHAKQFASITINEIQQKRCTFHSGSKSLRNFCERSEQRNG